MPKIYNWLKWYIRTGKVAIKLARETAAREKIDETAVFATGFKGGAGKAFIRSGERVIRPKVAAKDNW